MSTEPTTSSSGITHQRAKKLATEHLASGGSPLVATHATKRRGSWLVSYGDPERPDELVCGGCLIVQDDGTVHEVGSLPDELDEVLMDLEHSRRIGLVEEVALGQHLAHFGDSSLVGRPPGGVPLSLSRICATSRFAPHDIGSCCRGCGSCATP
jgi:hypothetical protein